MLHLGKEWTILEKKIGIADWWLERERKREKKNSPEKEDRTWVNGIKLKKKMMVWKKKKKRTIKEWFVVARKEVLTNTHLEMK